MKQFLFIYSIVFLVWLVTLVTIQACIKNKIKEDELGQCFAGGMFILCLPISFIIYYLAQ